MEIIVHCRMAHIQVTMREKLRKNRSSQTLCYFLDVYVWNFELRECGCYAHQLTYPILFFKILFGQNNALTHPLKTCISFFNVKTKKKTRFLANCSEYACYHTLTPSVWPLLRWVLMSQHDILPTFHLLFLWHPHTVRLAQTLHAWLWYVWLSKGISVLNFVEDS